jgi:photosystem II stability/assembly factor-like uncharacterized protein
MRSDRPIVVSMARSRRPRKTRPALVLGFVPAVLLFCAALLPGRQVGAHVGDTATPVPVAVSGDALTTLVPAPADAPAIYAAGGAALYRSGDGGISWQQAGPLPPPGRVIAAVDDPILLLAGTYPPCTRAGGDDRPLYRSDDAGATWQEVAGVTGILPLAAWNGSGLIVGASCAGLQLSTDGGRRWQRSSVVPADFHVSVFAPLAGADPTAPAGLVIGTSERGTSQLWRVDLSDPSHPTASHALLRFWAGGAAAGDGDRYVVGTATGVFVSNDAGATWQQSRAGLEDVTVSVDPLRTPVPDEERRRGFGISAVALDPGHLGHLWAGTIGGLAESNDGGGTWTRVDDATAPVEALVVAPKGGLLLAQTADAIVTVPLAASVRAHRYLATRFGCGDWACPAPALVNLRGEAPAGKVTGAEYSARY